MRAVETLIEPFAVVDLAARRKTELSSRKKKN